MSTSNGALTIRSGGQSHAFRVEVARTEEEQASGLMFRESLAPDAGMLFPFPVPRPASFWMKNTLIPLDMIFVRPDGSIGRIAVNTIPHSPEPVGVEEATAMPRCDIAVTKLSRLATRSPATRANR